MKILQVCLKPPAPAVDGGTRAMIQLSELLHLCGHEVKVIAANTHKHFVRKEEIPALYLQKYSPEYVSINTKINPLTAFINLLGSQSYHSSRFFSPRFLEKMELIIEKNKFDAVIFDSVIMAVYMPYLKKKFNCRFFIRSHNIENEIWSLLGLESKFFLKKWYLGLQAKRLKAFEEEMFTLADGIISINFPDSEYIKKFNTKTITVPFTVENGVNKVATNQSEVLRLYHIASMDWLPNAEGIEWFYHEVWKKYFHHNPKFELTLAGRKMPFSFYKFTSGNINVYGEINNIEAFISNFQVMICPLFAGSGIRIKIVEALSLGKVVVSTALGAAGIPFEKYYPSPLIIANNAEDFHNAIVSLSQENLEERIKNGLQLIQEYFTPQSYVSNLNNFLNGRSK